MMILWISCLLIGSITCAPVWKKEGSGTPGSGSDTTAPTYPAAGGSGGAGFYPGVHAGGYDGSGGSYGAGVYAGGYDGSGGSYGAGYGAGSGSGSGGAGWSAGSTSYDGAGAQSSGPIFSDVSDLDPVYGFSHRSRYQRGRAVFAQSRYTPGELLVQPMPIYRPVIKNPVMLNIPVQEPVQLQVPVKAPQQQVQTQQGY